MVLENFVVLTRTKTGLQFVKQQFEKLHLLVLSSIYFYFFFLFGQVKKVTFLSFIFLTSLCTYCIFEWFVFWKVYSYSSEDVTCNSGETSVLLCNIIWHEFCVELKNVHQKFDQIRAGSIEYFQISIPVICFSLFLH